MKEGAILANDFACVYVLAQTPKRRLAEKAFNRPAPIFDLRDETRFDPAHAAIRSLGQLAPKLGRVCPISVQFREQLGGCALTEA